MGYWTDPDGALSHAGQRFVGAAAGAAGSQFIRSASNYLAPPRSSMRGGRSRARPAVKSMYKNKPPPRRRVPYNTIGSDPVQARAYVRNKGRGVDRVTGRYGRASDFGGPIPVGKYIDFNFALEVPANNSSTHLFDIDDRLVLIPPVTSGAALPESSRTANTAIITSIHIQGHFHLPAYEGTLITAITSGAVKLMIVLDKQCNGAKPAAADIFNTASSPFIFGFENQNNGYRFEVLGEYTIPYSRVPYFDAGAGNVVLQSHVQEVDFHVNDLSIPIEYNNATGGTGATSERRSNNILLCFGQLSLQSMSFNIGAPNIQVHSRVTFIDG